MALPQIPNIARSREHIQEFRGYNHNLRIAENEFFDELNMSAENYPVLSTRRGRREAARIDGNILGSAVRATKLYYVLYDESEEKTKLMMRNLENETDTELGSWSSSDGESTRTLLFFGTSLLIFPDWYALDTVQKEATCNQICNFQPRKCILKLCYKNGDKYVAFDDFVTVKERVYKSPGIGQQIAEKNGGTATVCVVDDENNFLWLGELDANVNADYDDYCTRRYLISELAVYIQFDAVNYLPSKGESKINYGWPLHRTIDGNTPIEGEATVDDNGYHIIVPCCAIPFSSITAEDNRTVTASYKTFDTSASDIVDAEATFSLDHDLLKVKQAFKLNADYITECQNRLWACYYGEKDGAMVNEIFCSALGKYDEWSSYEDPASGPYRASIGTFGPFTGVTVVNQNPVFFKEDAVHKVYVSPSGAHQIVTVNCPGVADGSSRSVAHVNGYLLYKTRNDVVIFDGSNVTPISQALGSERYSDAICGSHGNKYVMWCKDKAGMPTIFTYDLSLGLWHREDAPEELKYFINTDGSLYSVCENDGALVVYEHNSGISNVPFMLQTGELGLSSPDKKYISRIDLRVSLSRGAEMQVFLQYDSNGAWEHVGALRGCESVPRFITLPILPRRCDHFRMKIIGVGSFNLYSITKLVEEGA